MLVWPFSGDPESDVPTPISVGTVISRGASAVCASVTIVTGMSADHSDGTYAAQPAGFFFFFFASAGPAVKAPTTRAADATTDRALIVGVFISSPPKETSSSFHETSARR